MGLILKCCSSAKSDYNKNCLDERYAPCCCSMKHFDHVILGSAKILDMS